MKTALKMILAAAGVFSLFVNASTAETVVKVDSVKIERVQSMDSPTIQAQTKDMRFKPKAWAYLEAAIKVDARDTVTKKAPLFLNDLKVKFYVAVKTPADERPIGALLLTKEITYVNVPVGETFYVCVFLAPSSVKRLTGGDSVLVSLFEKTGVSISYGEQNIYPDSKSKKKQWWESEKLIPSGNYPLLSKNQTPFMMLWYDRYPEVSPKNDEGSAGGISPAPAAE